MSENNTNFKEQDAPLKNTDDAFVQVGKDGSPVMPSVEKEQSDNEIKKQNDEAEKANTSSIP